MLTTFFSFTRRWGIWKHFANYFPISLAKTAELDPNKSYLLGSHPHGLLCAGAFCAFATDALDFTKVFPGMKLLWILGGGRSKVDSILAYCPAALGLILSVSKNFFCYRRDLLIVGLPWRQTVQSSIVDLNHPTLHWREQCCIKTTLDLINEGLVEQHSHDIPYVRPLYMRMFLRTIY